MSRLWPLLLLAITCQSIHARVMYFACRICLAIAFICSSIFLLAGTAESQIQLNPTPNLRYSPAAAACESAISAKVQTDHDTLAHFDANTRVQQDMVGQTRVGGYGDFSGIEDTLFTFNCVFDEHNKTIASAFYTVYQVGSKRLVPPENQAQDCQERVTKSIGRVIPKSIKSKTKKNGDRIIYGDGSLPGRPFSFQCTYDRDDKFIAIDSDASTPLPDPLSLPHLPPPPRQPPPPIPPHTQGTQPF